jgi:hypothetical protein
MPDLDPRFFRAVDRFDALNAEDPNVTLVAGKPQPKELVYARRMSEWLLRLEPNASETLRLAARGQHLLRWHIPRDTFPKDRAGYLNWRTKLYDFHADAVSQVLRSVGYEENTIARVASLVRKENLKTHPDAQLLEDVVCLVFLENYFADFARDHDEAKLIRILRRTWKKMSPRGHDAAMTLELGERERELIARAIAGDSAE